SRSAGAWILPGWIGYVTPPLGWTRTRSGSAITARPGPTAIGARVGDLPRGPSVTGSGGANDTDDARGLSTRRSEGWSGMPAWCRPSLIGRLAATSGDIPRLFVRGSAPVLP